MKTSASLLLSVTLLIHHEIAATRSYDNWGYSLSDLFKLDMEGISDGNLVGLPAAGESRQYNKTEVCNMIFIEFQEMSRGMSARINPTCEVTSEMMILTGIRNHGIDINLIRCDCRDGANEQVFHITRKRREDDDIIFFVFEGMENEVHLTGVYCTTTTMFYRKSVPTILFPEYSRRYN